MAKSSAGNLITRIQQFLLNNRQEAFALRSQVAGDLQRGSLASLIAQSWARQDINAAWNAVTFSGLSASEKQLMLNELWG